MRVPEPHVFLVGDYLNLGALAPSAHTPIF